MKVNEETGHQDMVMYFSTAFNKLDASILGQTMFDSPQQLTSLEPQGIFLSAAMTSAEMVSFSSQPLLLHSSAFPCRLSARVIWSEGVEFVHETQLARMLGQMLQCFNAACYSFIIMDSCSTFCQDITELLCL